MNNTITKSLLYWTLFTSLLFALSLLTALAPPHWSRLLQALLGSLAAFFLIRLFLKYEKRTFSDIGLVWDRLTIVRFLLGVLAGAAIFAVILFVLLNFTGLELKRNANTVTVQTCLAALLVIIPFALMEELAFRSYTLLKLEKTYGLLWAQIITAIAFALYHIVSGWNWTIALLGPGSWAFMFGLAAIWSRGIAVPTGLHAALNFLQVLVGMKAGKASLWTLNLKHTTAEASAITNRVGIGIQIAILLIGLILTYLFARRKKHSTQIF
jgi:membrane protease YdiL (CAAX protease family)